LVNTHTPSSARFLKPRRSMRSTCRTLKRLGMVRCRSDGKVDADELVRFFTIMGCPAKKVSGCASVLRSAARTLPLLRFPASRAPKPRAKLYNHALHGAVLRTARSMPHPSAAPARPYSDDRKSLIANRNNWGLARGDRKWKIPERWTNPKPSRRACTHEHGLQSCRAETASRAISHPKSHLNVTSRRCRPLKSYGYAQPDVQDMIWEVDEDCDQCVSWQEFQSMYRRCRNDTTGYEPRRLFNVVEFVMNDKDDSGTVSVEEAMSVLYLRYGKGVLDEVRTTLQRCKSCES
jgi:hypothetical protein